MRSAPAVGRDLEFWRRPPAWVFHAVLVPPTIGVLWACSVPGLAFFLWSGATAVLGLAAVVWAGRLVSYLVARRRGESRGHPLWFGTAPAAAIAVFAALAADMPLRARWAASRAEFEQVVDRVMQNDADATATRRRVGLYDITVVQREGDAVVFYERTGALADDAGFVFFPNGPRDDIASFESPQYVHLGGSWYAFTASW